MKKYAVLSVVVVLLISTISSMMMWNQRTSFTIAYDEENTTGDRSLMDGVQFSFGYTLEGNSQPSGWEVTGNGDKFTIEYLQNAGARLYNMPTNYLEFDGPNKNHLFLKVLTDEKDIEYVSTECMEGTNGDGNYISSCYNEGLVDVVNYGLLVNTETPFKKFQATSSIGEGISVMYSEAGVQVQSNGPSNYNVTGGGVLPGVEIHGNNYFILSENNIGLSTLSDDIMFSQVDMGGIYKVDKAQNVTQIVSLELGVEEILQTVAYKDKIVCIVADGKETVLRVYTTKGDIVYEELYNAEYEIGTLLECGDYIMHYKPESFIKKANIYGFEQDEFKQLDSFETAQNIESTSFMYQNGLLYSIYVSQETNRVSMNVQDKKEYLFTTVVSSDFDSLITTSYGGDGQQQEFFAFLSKKVWVNLHQFMFEHRKE